MKSEKKEAKGKKFPHLGESPDGSIVVLFYAASKGVVVWSKGAEEGRIYEMVGTHRDDWILPGFTEFRGEITLFSS